MKRIFALLFTGLMLFSLNAYSQNQVRITGRIADQTTGELLLGASVVVKGTTIGTVTGLDGEYSIVIPSSNDTLVFSYIGYDAQEIVVGTDRVIDIDLMVNTTDLEEVVVTVQARGQIGARQSQLNSLTLKNVVAPDRLQENPDANAIEALGRLPGMSVLRSGGEGSQLVIRGMQPQYTNVTLDGVNLAGGQTNLRGISQYALQGAEVYKSLTPDLEATGVGGTVNLLTQDAREGWHYNIMAQGGYNDLNNYFGNYLFNAEVSNRFFDNKFGVSLNASAEQVNRGTQTMSASFVIPGQEIDILLNGSSLNVISRINTRRSVNLSMDYRLGSSTVLKLNGIYSYSNFDTKRQSKNYNHTGAGGVNYSMQYDPINKNNGYHTALSGRTNAKWLNMEIDYGVAFSQNKGSDPDNRYWGFNVQGASTADITTVEMRRLSSEELIPLFTDKEAGEENTSSGGFGHSRSEQSDQDISANLDLTIPYRSGDFYGNVKFGGKYRKKELYVDQQRGRGGLGQFNEDLFYDNLPYLVHGPGLSPSYALVGFEDYEVEDFLDGAFDYGTYYSFDMLNGITDFWDNFSDSLYALGPEVYLPLVGFKQQNLGYIQVLEASMYSDRDIVQDYYAGYLMAEMNFGRWATFIPGFRYEATDSDMNGMITLAPDANSIPNDIEPTLGQDTSVVRSDEFFLPMVHLRIKPTKFVYLHLAYTKTISRPGFNEISPNIYIDPHSTPGIYKTKNPELRTEQWTNYDAQLTFHNSKIGLLSLGVFYKTVEDKYWNRSYKRIAGDPPVPFYLPNSVVDMDVWENHPYDVTLQGFEFEWQTSFWYLPKPFNYFTLSVNYTFTDSETKYSKTRLEQVIPEGGGRPVTVRIDSVISGRMLYQPMHIINASLGFEYKGLNSWLSFQYNGQIYTSKNPVVDELDGLKENFYRIDLQVTYDLPLSIPGTLQVMSNFANLSNYQEISRLRGDPRFTYREAYGFSIDLGVRYRF